MGLSGQQVAIAWGEPGPASAPTPKPKKPRDPWLQRRIDAGICARCANEPAEPGRQLGPICGKRTREYSREFQRTMRNSGVCSSCAKAPAWRCQKCVTCYPVWRGQKYAYELRKVAEGGCRRCSEKREQPQKQFCNSCQAKRDGEHKRSAARRRAARLAATPCACGKVKGTWWRRPGRGGGKAVAVCEACAAKHGSVTAWKNGCRCETCKAAKRKQDNAVHARRRLRDLAGRACACGQSEPRLMRIRFDGRVQCARCFLAERPPPQKRPVNHGASAYANGSCRCDVCREAHRVYRKALRSGSLAALDQAERGSQPGG